MKSTVNRHHKF